MSGFAQDQRLKAIEAKLGRPLRILHIGNIANNAYNNARLQRQLGIEADVLCYDYYHVMATPEWEDAQFQGDVDPDAPNWWDTSLKGWKRPEWFVQGPAGACLQYLRAKHLGYGGLQKLLWRYLEDRCLDQARATAKLKGKNVRPVPPALDMARRIVETTGAANGPAHRIGSETISAILALRTSSLDPLFPIDELDPRHGVLVPPKPTPLAADMLQRTYSLVAKLALRPAHIGYRIAFDYLVRDGLNRPDKLGALANVWLAQRRWRRGVEDVHLLRAEIENMERGSALLKSALSRMRGSIKRAFNVNRVKNYIRVKWFLLYSKSEALSQINLMAQAKPDVSTSERDKKFKKLIEDNAKDLERYPFEDRVLFFVHYATFGSQFLDIFENYDVVQAYSIDGCLCVVNGYDRFISYEHGTLRDMPFGLDFYGIVTPITYRASTYVFVTNSDVMPSVERLQLDPGRVVCLPHAFDDRKLVRFRAENPELQPPAGPPVIFSPARQHWTGSVVSWLKGNDVLLRAGGILAAEGLDFRFHLIEWGEQVALSKALIAELGIADKVVWLPTMKKHELWRAYCESHVVVDQFAMPALGGVGFEAMTLGRRLVTAIDETQLRQFFGEAPPCLAALTVEQCAAQLRRAIADPQDKAGLGAAAQAWMRTYHSAERIMNIQIETYGKFLDDADTGTQN